ncbi:fungal hydrophobin-domain-containing protein [Cubamyces menziesii]|uniref:Hydrophobin n=1 Tax=Trametes cubensis TaxID=1111947 RepID=A0AAD7TZ91_9APHY|nr:fungal hydrophobin-domain-containing protein [Cubamyces menziesii]KAJ8489842.1 hypothetical protein ONZ51_g2697 [Trametes cubensis]
MFSGLAAATTLALPLLAAAQNCNTGPVQCCNTLEDTNSAAGAALLDLLHLNAQDIVGQIGLECNPIDVIGVGEGAHCAAQPVCCQNNNVGGLASIGCVPVQL